MDACQLPDLSVLLAYTNDTLGKRGPRKGKKVPRDLVRQLMQQRDAKKLCVEGAAGVGKTTALQILAATTYSVVTAPSQLSTATQFDPTVFQEHVERWTHICSTVGSVVVESSPWGYLLQTGSTLPP